MVGGGIEPIIFLEIHFFVEYDAEKNCGLFKTQTKFNSTTIQ